MSIGERIRKRRKQLGLTQIELAHRLGLKSKAAISTVENDKENMTSIRIEQYANALDTTPAYLMGWIQDPEISLNEAIKKNAFESNNKTSTDGTAVSTVMLTKEENSLINLYRKLNTQQKDTIMQMIYTILGIHSDTTQMGESYHSRNVV